MGVMPCATIETIGLEDTEETTAMPNVGESYDAPPRATAEPGTAGVVVYDANALFSKAVHYLLLGVAQAGLVRAKFGANQLFESAGSLAARQRWDSLEDLVKTLRRMESVVRDNTVRGYERWVPRVKGMSDRGDVYIVAIAIASGAPLIVTDNIRDFPRAALDPWSIRTQRPDAFLLDCFAFNPALVVSLCERHPRGATYYLAKLRDVAPRTAAAVTPYVH